MKAAYFAAFLLIGFGIYDDDAIKISTGLILMSIWAAYNEIIKEIKDATQIRSREDRYHWESVDAPND